jgi:hypothetical protein
MKIVNETLRRRYSAFLRVAAPVLALSMLAHPAHAEVMLAQNTFFSGTDSQTLTVDAPAAGTMSLTVTDTAFPVALTSLSFYGSNETSVLQAASSTGSTMTYDLTSAGAFYAHISADAGSLGIPGLPNYGWFAVDINFTPAQAPVPLPASAGLLLIGLAGLGALGVLRRARRPADETRLVAA